ncbi:uncharacterized protein LOC144633285 [Oculina patagonica]
MEGYRTRTLSTGDDISEIVSGMELHERMPEHTNREFHNNPRNNFWSGFSLNSTAEDSDEHSVHNKPPKEHGYIYTFLSTMLFVVVLIVENIFHYKLFENTHASIFFYWLESCVIALFFRFWGRKRIRSFRSQASHFLPMLFLHVVTVTAFALDFNSSGFGLSAGSASYLVSLALTLPLVLLASWVTNRQSYPDKIIIFVSISCALLMVLFCTLEDSIADYSVSFSDGAFAFIMSTSLAFFTVHAKRYLPKATRAELLYLLNFTSVVCLPFIALLFGELPALEAQLSKRRTLELIFSLFIMAVLRLASQAACLYQLKFSTPLLNTGARGFSWIWVTLAITFLSTAETGELVMSVFAAFWIYGLFAFLPILCSDLHFI